MTRLPTALLAACSLVFAFQFAAPSTAAAQDDDPPELAYRKGVMNSFRIQTGALRTLLGGEVAYPGHVAMRANSVRDLAMMLSDIFPAGSGGEGSRALPAIWEDAEGFAAVVAEMQAGAQRLADAAASGDMEATSEALRGVQQGCRSCHTNFRARGR